MQNVLEHPQISAEEFLREENIRPAAMERRTQWLQNALSIALKAYATPVSLPEPAIAPLPSIDAPVAVKPKAVQEMSRTAAFHLMETFELSFPADLV